jgi:predicted PurR-regulated permease PerM
MAAPQPDSTEKIRMPHNKVVFYALQITALGLLLYYCYGVIEPFVILIVWGAILAVTLYPLHKMLSRRLNNRKSLSAILITIALFALIIGPAVWLLISTYGEVSDLVRVYRAGNLSIPLPNENVQSWPLIGNKAYEYWMAAHNDLSGLLAEHGEELRPIAIKALVLLSDTGKGLLLFAGSIIVSGIMLVYAEGAGGTMKKVLSKLAGAQGETMHEIAALTIRNVVKGILGVAIIQALLAGVGLVAAGVPLAGIWIILCLLLSVVQIGIFPVTIGVIIYIWGAADTTTALLLTIWMIIIGFVDNILKPILLGKGAPVPMLVIFMGTIGGFIHSGFIGLFTGAIFLSLGYRLFKSWTESDVIELPENRQDENVSLSGEI